MGRIKNHCIKAHLETATNKDLLNKLIPNQVKLWGANFIVPQTDETRNKCLANLKKLQREEEQEKELEINIMDMIPEEEDTESDRAQLVNEKQAAIIADMIMNHGKLRI